MVLPKLQSPVAQLVEQVAVNHLVTGSSPVGGARFFSTERNPRPVNARRREIGSRAFRVLGLYSQGFTTIRGANGHNIREFCA